MSATPESIKNEPWTSFQRQTYSFIRDDFPHEKFLTLKTNLKGNSSIVKTKNTLDRKGESMKLTEDLKFWFDVRNNKKVYFRIREDRFKVHFDNGITEFKNDRRYNFYGSLQSDRNLTGGAVKLGAAYIGTRIKCDNRIRFDGFDAKPARFDATFYHKSWYRLNDRWQFHMYGVVGLVNRYLLNNGVLLTYQRDNHQFFFRGEAALWRKQKPEGFGLGALFREFYFDYVKHLSDVSKAGVQLHLYSATGQIQGVTAAYERHFKEENATVKWKFNSAMKFALAIKRAMGSYGDYTFGFEISDLGRANNIKFGSEFNINL